MSRQFEDLWADFLEGELDDRGFADLERLLASDPALLSRATDLYEEHRLLGLLLQGQFDDHEEHLIATLRSRLKDQTDRHERRPSRIWFGLLGNPRGLDGAAARSSEPAPQGAIAGARHRAPFSRAWKLAGAAWPIDPRLNRVLRGALLTGAAASILTAIALLGVSLWRGRTTADPVAVATRRSNSATPSADGSTDVAILTRAVDVVWADPNKAPTVGSSLAHDTLRLRSGFLQLEFCSGAIVVVEGPAEIELLAIDKISCRFGKLRALVPPRAQGFRVESPTMDLVDLGTEFGMQVDAGRKSEVHVFRGKVEVHESAPRPGRPEKWDLTEGHGMRIATGGEVTEVAAQSPAFLGQPELERRYIEESHRRYSEWLVQSHMLRGDPRLIAYFSFEGDHEASSRRTLVNQLGDRSADGAIVGCDWVDGRWPGKGALEFKRPTDRVRIRVDGEWESLTLCAWVRIDAIQRRRSSLMLTDGFDPREVHWEIDQSGRIVLGISNTHSPGEQYAAEYVSPTVITSEQVGRWTMLATVYDDRAEKVTHYVDGVEVSSKPIARRGVLRIGDAELGNWGVRRSNEPSPVRSLCGRMDEFALFREALGSDQMRALYEKGMPGQ
jgi:Concanavalin A-like lectin/glucanases superfamily